MRGQAFVELSQVARDLFTWLMDNPHKLEIVTKAQEDRESLSPEERRLATLWNMNEAQYHELAYVLWQEGAIDEASYLVREKYFLSLLIGGSGRRTWWDNYVYLIDQRFIDRINAQLEVVEKQGIKVNQCISQLKRKMTHNKQIKEMRKDVFSPEFRKYIDQLASEKSSTVSSFLAARNLGSVDP